MKTFNCKIGDTQLRPHSIETKQIEARQTTYELHVTMLVYEIIEFVPLFLLRFTIYLRWALLGHGPYLGWGPYIQETIAHNTENAMHAILENAMHAILSH